MRACVSLSLYGYVACVAYACMCVWERERRESKMCFMHMNRRFHSCAHHLFPLHCTFKPLLGKSMLPWSTPPPSTSTGDADILHRLWCTEFGQRRRISEKCFKTHVITHNEVLSKSLIHLPDILEENLQTLGSQHHEHLTFLSSLYSIFCDFL